MKLLLLLLLLLLSLRSGPGHALNIRRPMWKVSDPKPWNEAGQHCRREFGGDLLTAVSQDELDQMDLSSFYAWVGIHATKVGHYHWADDDPNTSGLDYTNKHPAPDWTPEDPTPDVMDCVCVQYRTDKTHGALCTEPHFFFCSGLLAHVFVPEAKTWSNAQSHCKNAGMSLSEFRVQSGPRWPGSPFYVTREFPVWIGLHGNGGSWKWSDQNQSDFRNWAPDLGGAPAPAPGSCVVVSSQSKSMSVKSCSEAFPFLCYRHNVVLVQELLSWEQALETCRTLTPTSSSFEFLRVQQSLMDNIRNVLRFTTTDKVWVGLRFLGGSWFWTDGGAVSLSLPQCPESGLHCGALVLNRTSGSDLIEPSDCSQRLNVLCYGEP